MSERVILSVAAAQHELETVAALMESIGAVVAEARRNDWWRGHDAGERAEWERRKFDPRKFMDSIPEPTLADLDELRRQLMGEPA